MKPFGEEIGRLYEKGILSLSDDPLDTIQYLTKSQLKFDGKAPKRIDPWVFREVKRQCKELGFNVTMILTERE